MNNNEHRCNICDRLIGQFGDIKKKKCILHCEKDDWYVDENGKKDWSQSEDKIRKFWEEIRNVLKTVSKDIINLSNFIFPKFEEITPDDRVQLHNEDYTLKQKTTSKNFWSNGSIIEFNYDILFTKCIFLDIIDFYGCKFQSVIFVESEIREPIHFTESKIFGLLKFQNTIIQESLDFKTTELTEIVIEECKEINKISFNRSTIRTFVIIQGKSNINDLNFELCRFKVLKINNCSINKLGLMKYSSCLDYMQFEDVKINKLNLSNFDVFNCNTIFFKNCSLDEFSIIRFIGIPKFVTLNDLIVKRKVEIEDSNLSNFEFNKLDISEALKKLHNVSFVSNNGITIFNGVRWGDIRNTFVKATDRDTYRQLKIVNEKQGNYIEANKFYSSEMEAYKKELRDNKNKHNWQDRVIFWLNEKSSNFSQNWLKPLGWFFLLGFIAFVLSNFCKILSYLNDTSKITLITFWNTFNQYFKYLNPFNTSAGEWSPVIWLIFKALSVFIIYQFIISLRRQTRR